MEKKDFQKWCRLKQALNNKPFQAHVRPRQIWWCSLGVNIGFEADGKHENFERPVLVLRVHNKETLLIAPLTGKERDDKFHYPVETGQRKSWVSLTQIRTISHRRLIREIGWIPKEEFACVLEAVREFI